MIYDESKEEGRCVVRTCLRRNVARESDIRNAIIGAEIRCPL